MTVGFAVQGPTDRAFLDGLRRRWCPGARLIEGHARGSTHLSIRREIPKICRELDERGASLIVFLTDADERPWREVLARETALVPQEYQYRVLYGVAGRNVECWIAVDRQHAADMIAIDSQDLNVTDPKPVVEKALGITTFERHEDRIAEIVRTIPRARWLNQPGDAAESLAKFYEDARDLAQTTQCTGFPNERDSA